MVQVFKQGPTEGDLRQRAFQQGMDQMVAGGTGLGQAMSRKQAAEELMKRQAMQDQLAQEDRIMRQSQAGSTYQPQIDMEQGEGYVAESPEEQAQFDREMRLGSMSKSIVARGEQERAQKQRMGGMQEQLMQAKIGALGKKGNGSTADAGGAAIDKELNAVGYNLNPDKTGVLPSKMEARQFRGAVAEGEAFKNNIAKISKLLDSHGGVPSSIGSPNVHNTMQQGMTSAMLDLKGEAFYKLGVLAGPDMDLIKNAFGDIDSLLGTYQPGNLGIAKAKLQEVAAYVDNKIKTKSESLGYSNNSPSEVVADAPRNQPSLPMGFVSGDGAGYNAQSLQSQIIPQVHAAGSVEPSSDFAAPERVQYRQSRLQELRIKAGR